MMTYREIAQIVREWIEDDSNPQGMRRTINSVIKMLTGEMRFDALQEQVEVTPDANGRFLEPALCKSIVDVVYDGSQRFRAARGPALMQGVVRLFDRMYPVGTGSTWDARNISFTFSSATPDRLTKTGSVAIPDGVVGRRLWVTNVNGFYEVTGIGPDNAYVTVRPDFTAPVTSGTMSIGNVGMNEYALVGIDGVPFLNPITISYQRIHPELHVDTDLLLVNIENSVALMAVQRILRINKYDVDALRLSEEIARAQAAEMGKELVNRPMQRSKPTMFHKGGSAGGLR